MDGDALTEMIELLESDVVDDAEELLVWLGTTGVEALKELRELRRVLLEVTLLVLDAANPDDPCYNEQLVLKLDNGLSALLATKQ